MRKKTLSIVIILALSVQWVFALSIQQIADNAILRTQREANYGRYTIPLNDGNTSTIQFLNYELEQYQGDFKLIVTNAYNNSLTGNTWPIPYLDTVNTDRLNTYYSWTASSKERAKALLWTNIYRNFLTVWNDPNSEAPAPTVYPTTTVTSTGVVISTSSRTFTSIENYTASNGKTYTIRRSNDNLYRYRQNSWKSFSSETSVKTYLELKNRLIYIAPNNRRYAIFKVNGRYYFNRDEWSVSTLSRLSINDTKAYINQHNQALSSCQQVKEWRCY